MRAAKAEVAQIEQTLGEASCGSTAADAVIANGGDSAFTQDGSYDHATCRNAFIVDLHGQHAGGTVTAYSRREADPVWDLLGCWFTWTYGGLWRKDGTNYVKVTEGDAWGQLIQSKVPGGYNCIAHLDLTFPQDGDYKLVTGSAVWDGPMLPVSVSTL